MILVIDRPHARFRPDLDASRIGNHRSRPFAEAPPWPGPPVPRPSTRRDPANPDWRPV